MFTLQICLRHAVTEMWIPFFLVLVAIICVSHATVSDSFLGEGENLIVKVAAQFKTRTDNIMCQNRNKIIVGGWDELEIRVVLP